jgi:hypothetical protein
MSKNIIVEVEGYEGEAGSIVVTNARGRSSLLASICIGQSFEHMPLVELS